MSYNEYQAFIVSQIEIKESALELCLNIEAEKDWKLELISPLKNNEYLVILSRKTSWFKKLFRS